MSEEKNKCKIRTKIVVVKLNSQIMLETDEPLDKAMEAFNKLMEKYSKKGN